MRIGGRRQKKAETDPGYLELPLSGVAVAAAAGALACLAALVVVASIKRVETLSTVALALAIVTFVAQLIVFVVQAAAANQQTLQSQDLHAQLMRLLSEISERARGTEATVSTMNERLLEAALEKTVLGTSPQGETPAFDASSIATEVAELVARRQGVGGPVAPRTNVEVVDTAAHDAAKVRLERMPRSASLPEILDSLEALSAHARESLRRFARDEIRYTGTTLPPGLGVKSLGDQELHENGLVRPREDGSSLYGLTDRGRTMAAVLLSPEVPPESLVDRVRILRSE